MNYTEASEKNQALLAAVKALPEAQGVEFLIVVRSQVKSATGNDFALSNYDTNAKHAAEELAKGAAQLAALDKPSAWQPVG